MIKLRRLIPGMMRCVPDIFIAGAIAVSLLVLAVGCSEPDISSPTLDDLREEQLPDQESWDTQFDVMESEQPRLRIFADYMAKFIEADSTYMLLQGHPDSLDSRVLAYLYDERGDSSATIVADEMIYYEDERRIESKGNVIVNTTDGKRLETEYLIWLERDRRVRTSGFVHITTPRENIQGYNLDADEDLENYEIARVTGQAIVDDL